MHSTCLHSITIVSKTLSKAVQSVTYTNSWYSHLTLVCRGPQEARTKGDNHRAEQAIDRGAEGLPGSHGASPACIPSRRDVGFTAPCHYALHCHGALHCTLHLCAAAHSMSFLWALPNKMICSTYISSLCLACCCFTFCAISLK